MEKVSAGVTCPRGHVAVPEDILGCHSWRGWGGRELLAASDRGQGCRRCPLMHGAAPPTEHEPAGEKLQVRWP